MLDGQGEYSHAPHTCACRYDPARRLTAEEALDHPFFKVGPMQHCGSLRAWTVDKSHVQQGLPSQCWPVAAYGLKEAGPGSGILGTFGLSLICMRVGGWLQEDPLPRRTQDMPSFPAGSLELGGAGGKRHAPHHQHHQQPQGAAVKRGRPGDAEVR